MYSFAQMFVNLKKHPQSHKVYNVYYTRILSLSFKDIKMRLETSRYEAVRLGEL